MRKASALMRVWEINFGNSDRPTSSGEGIKHMIGFSTPVSPVFTSQIRGDARCWDLLRMSFSPPDAACPNDLGAAGPGFLQNANERGTECNRGKGCIADAFAHNREKERNPF